MVSFNLLLNCALTANNSKVSTKRHEANIPNYPGKLSHCHHFNSKIPHLSLSEKSFSQRKQKTIPNLQSLKINQKWILTNQLGYKGNATKKYVNCSPPLPTKRCIDKLWLIASEETKPRRKPQPSHFQGMHNHTLLQNQQVNLNYILPKMLNQSKTYKCHTDPHKHFKLPRKMT